MNARIARLRAEIRSDRDAIRRWWDQLDGLDLASDADPATLSLAAWALHHAYSGVEAILERVMRTVEGSLPEGPDSHRALLEAACLELEGVRPPLLSMAVVQRLHELRGFRHFVRHAYAVALDPGRLSDLRALAAKVAPDLDRELDALDAWLDGLAEAAVGNPQSSPRIT